MKHWGITFLIIVALSIAGCGGGSESALSVSPEELKNQPPVATDDVYSTDKDTPLTVPTPGVLANDSDLEGDPLRALKVSGPSHGMLALNTDGSFIYIPDSDFKGTDSFTYKANDGEADSNIATVTISMGALNVTLNEDQAQAVLYTAYAGIGYMSTDDPDDNEALYDVMFDNLNSLVSKLFLDTIENDPDKGLKLLALFTGVPVTFTYQGMTLEISLGGLTDSGFIKFSATVSADFDPVGYRYKDCTYYGQNGSKDFVADISGYYSITIAHGLETLVKSVDIVAMDTLVALYPFGRVTYDEWRISYKVYYGEDDPEYPQGNHPETPVNLDILSFGGGGFYFYDFRNYTLGGSFSIDGDTYTFDNGFHYRQDQWCYNEGGQVVSKSLVIINGTLSLSGFDGFVAIGTPEDIINPVDSKTIIRNDDSDDDIPDGIWIFGKMTITSANSVNVEFNYDEVNGISSADFTGDLGSWTVGDWQNELDPIEP